MNLVDRLRTCPIEQRGAIAIQLAELGTDKAIDELVRMVEGRRKYKIRFWGGSYSYNDQLIGIEALGETGSKKALEYLKALISEKEFEGPEKMDDTSDSPIRCQVNFPRARGLGRLYKGLYLRVVYPPQPDRELEDNLETAKRYARELADSPELKINSATARPVVSRVYKIIYDSIKKLEAAVGGS